MSVRRVLYVVALLAVGRLTAVPAAKAFALVGGPRPVKARAIMRRLIARSARAFSRPVAAGCCIDSNGGRTPKIFDIPDAKACNNKKELYMVPKAIAEKMTECTVEAIKKQFGELVSSCTDKSDPGWSFLSDYGTACIAASKQNPGEHAVDEAMAATIVQTIVVKLCPNAHSEQHISAKLVLLEAESKAAVTKVDSILATVEKTDQSIKQALAAKQQLSMQLEAQEKTLTAQQEALTAQEKALEDARAEQQGVATEIEKLTAIQRSMSS